MEFPVEELFAHALRMTYYDVLGRDMTRVHPPLVGTINTALGKETV